MLEGACWHPLYCITLCDRGHFFIVSVFLTLFFWKSENYYIFTAV